MAEKLYKIVEEESVMDRERTEEMKRINREAEERERKKKEKESDTGSK